MKTVLSAVVLVLIASIQHVLPQQTPKCYADVIVMDVQGPFAGALQELCLAGKVELIIRLNDSRYKTESTADPCLVGTLSTVSLLSDLPGTEVKLELLLLLNGTTVDTAKQTLQPTITATPYVLVGEAEDVRFSITVGQRCVNSGEANDFQPSPSVPRKPEEMATRLRRETNPTDTQTEAYVSSTVLSGEGFLPAGPDTSDTFSGHSSSARPSQDTNVDNAVGGKSLPLHSANVEAIVYNTKDVKPNEEGVANEETTTVDNIDGTTSGDGPVQRVEITTRKVSVSESGAMETKTTTTSIAQPADYIYDEPEANNYVLEARDITGSPDFYDVDNVYDDESENGTSPFFSSSSTSSPVNNAIGVSPGGQDSSSSLPQPIIDDVANSSTANLDNQSTNTTAANELGTTASTMGHNATSELANIAIENTTVETATTSTPTTTTMSVQSSTGQHTPGPILGGVTEQYDSSSNMPEDKNHTSHGSIETTMTITTTTANPTATITQPELGSSQTQATATVLNTTESGVDQTGTATPPITANLNTTESQTTQSRTTQKSTQNAQTTLSQLNTTLPSQGTQTDTSAPTTPITGSSQVPTTQSQRTLPVATLPPLVLPSSTLPMGSRGNSSGLALTTDPEGSGSNGHDGGDDTFWPIVAALVIGIPSIIVFGIAITVIHKRRLASPARLRAASMYPSL